MVPKKVAGGKLPLGGYPNAMIQESFEEMSELLAEETVKHAGNFYSWLRHGERGEIGEKRFKDMWDKGYWDEFREQLVGSALGGAIGGAVGKSFFFSKAHDEKTKDRLIDIIADGS